MKMAREKPIEELIAKVEHHLIVIEEILVPAAEEALQKVRDESAHAWDAVQQLEKRVVKDMREQ
jgi:hypothetical protein